MTEIVSKERLKYIGWFSYLHSCLLIFVVTLKLFQSKSNMSLLPLVFISFLLRFSGEVDVKCGASTGRHGAPQKTPVKMQLHLVPSKLCSEL